MIEISSDRTDWRSIGVIASVCTLVALAAISPPAALLLVFGTFATISRRKVLHALWLMLTLMCITLVLNLSKKPYNDWAWYSYHYQWLRIIPFSQYLGSRFDQFTIKASEPVYYFISSVLSKVTNGDVQALATFVTIWVYAPVVALVCRSFESLRDRPFVRVLLEFSVCLAGISFTLTLHLVRQEVAAGFLMWGYLLYRLGYGRLGFLVAAFGSITHNSAAAPLLLFVGCHQMRQRLKGTAATMICAAWGMLIGGTILWSSINANYYADGRSDGTISAATMLFDLLIGLAVYGLYRHKRIAAPSHQTELLFLIALAAMLAMLSPLPIPFLRMYFYFEGARVVMLCILLNAVVQRNNIPAALLVLLCSILLFTLRVWRSPFEFGEGTLHEIFAPSWSLLSSYIS